MLVVGEIHAPLFPRILYIEYLLSVSSYCLLVCSCVSCLFLLELISFPLGSLELSLVFHSYFLREFVLLHWLYLALSR